MNMKRIIGLVMIAVLIIGGIFIWNNVINEGDYRLKYEEEIVKYSKENDVDPYLVAVIIRLESGFHNYISYFSDREEKIGLMQIKGPTGEKWAKEMGLKDFEWDDLKDVETNVKVGTWYLGKLKKEKNDEDYMITGWYNRHITDEKEKREATGKISYIKSMKKTYMELYPEELK